MTPKSVLIVDDEQVNLDFLSIIFEDDYNLYQAKDGSEAFDIFQENQKIDAVLTDLRMPIMDGISLAKKVKEINPKVPCYLLTGYDISETITNAMDQGIIKKYFSKPLDIASLTTQLEAELSVS